MSTDYSPVKDISLSDLFDGRLEAWGIREHFVPDKTTEHCRCLTDGNNCLWVTANEGGIVTFITRYARNASAKIVWAISEAFETEIFSEHQPQFWGFDTQEEWDAYLDKTAKEHEEQFHIELLKHLRGEANNIQPGTNGMLMAQIAERLVAEDSDLLLPINKDKLRDAIASIYDRDHVIQVELSDQQIAAAQMMATHEDDLPSA